MPGAGSNRINEFGFYTNYYTLPPMRFRNDEYFKTMIYLGCGKLNLNIQIP